MLPGHRKVGGWPVTVRLQVWLGGAAGVAAGIAVASMAQGFRTTLVGLAIAAAATVPHECLHRAAARWLGLEARVRWGLAPRTQSEGVLRMWQVPVTSLAPQIVTLCLAAGAAWLRSPVLAIGAIGHAAVSAGDYAHAVYALVAAALPGTRKRVLLNGPGPEAGLYERIGGGWDGS